MHSISGGWIRLGKAIVNNKYLDQFKHSEKIEDLDNPITYFTKNGLTKLSNIFTLKQIRFECYKMSSNRKLHLQTRLDNEEGIKAFEFFVGANDMATCANSYHSLLDDTSIKLSGMYLF